MKYKNKRTFRDKNDRTVVHRAGEVEDYTEARAAEILAKGDLIELMPGQQEPEENEPADVPEETTEGTADGESEDAEVKQEKPKKKPAKK